MAQQQPAPELRRNLPELLSLAWWTGTHPRCARSPLCQAGNLAGASLLRAVRRAAAR